MKSFARLLVLLIKYNSLVTGMNVPLLQVFLNKNWANINIGRTEVLHLFQFDNLNF